MYGAHVATTLAPILAELYNPAYGLSEPERYMLFGFYLPYLIIPLLILADSYARVSQAMAVRTKTE